MSAYTYDIEPGATCGWLIQVPSGNPEPDFPSDCYLEVECGAPLAFNTHGSWRCDAGHDHVSMEDPERGAFEYVLMAEEAAAEQGW